MSDRQLLLPSCRYTMPATTRGECPCPVCDADGCEECIAHLRPDHTGQRWCERHFLFGTSNAVPTGGLIDYIKDKP